MYSYDGQVGEWGLVYLKKMPCPSQYFINISLYLKVTDRILIMYHDDNDIPNKELHNVTPICLPVD